MEGTARRVDADLGRHGLGSRRLLAAQQDEVGVRQAGDLARDSVAGRQRQAVGHPPRRRGRGDGGRPGRRASPSDAFGPPMSRHGAAPRSADASRNARSAASWPRRSACSRGRGTPGISPGSRSSSLVSGGIGVIPDEVRQARRHRRADRYRDAVGRVLGIDDDAARRLGRRDGEEGRPQALVEAQRLGLEPVGALGAVAPARRASPISGGSRGSGSGRAGAPTTTRSRAARVSASTPPAAP